MTINYVSEVSKWLHSNILFIFTSFTQFLYFLIKPLSDSFPNVGMLEQQLGFGLLKKESIKFVHIRSQANTSAFCTVNCY